MPIQDKKNQNQNKIVKIMDIVSQSDILKQPKISKLKEAKSRGERSFDVGEEAKETKKKLKISFRGLFKRDKFQDEKLENEKTDESVKIEKIEKSKDDLIMDFFKPREPKIEIKKEAELRSERNSDSEAKIEKEDEEDFLKGEINDKKIGFQRSKIKTYFALFLFLIFISAGIYSIIVLLPTADIKIVVKKADWSFNETIFASKNIIDLNSVNKQIPATFFSETKNISLSFDATGKKNAEEKSSGEIIIYNSFSSSQQFLVENTRFETPDGKIFYTDGKLTIPGVKVSDGKIIPSSIKARVIAEKAGQDYNIGPVEKFTIPGFKNNSAKYAGFYGKSENAMAGGFIGEVLYPTETDIKAAKDKAEAVLKESLSVLMMSQIPNGFKVIDSGKQFKIIKENIDKEADKNGKFSLFFEGEMTIAAFKEEDVLKLMAVLAKQSLGENFEAENSDFSYGVGQIDVQNGKFSFLFNYKGTFWQPIDIEKFKSVILEKKEIELKIAVFALLGVEKATVSFWPFWVKTVPQNIDRIKVVVE